MLSALQPVAVALVRAFAPLRAALLDGTGVQLRVLLRQLGWELDVAPVLEQLPIVERLPPLIEEAEALVGQISSAASGDAATYGALVLELLDLVLGEDGILAALDALHDEVPGEAAVPEPMKEAAFWSELALELPNLLLLRYLETWQPALHGAIRLLGLLDESEVEPGEDEASWRGTWTRQTLRLQRVFGLLQDPLGYVRDLHGWRRDGSASGFDAEAARTVVDELASALRALGVRARKGTVRSRFTDGSLFAADSALPASVRELAIPLVQGRPAGLPARVELGVLVLPVPEAPGDPDVAGLYLCNLSWGAASLSTPLSDDWEIEVSSELDGTGATGVLLFPNEAPRLLADGGASGTFSLALATREGRGPFPIFGGEEGTRLSCSRAALGLDLGLDGGEADASVWLETGGGGSAGLALVVDLSEGDSLVRDLLGGEPIEAELDFALHWSAQSGLEVVGSAGFEVVLLIGKQLGPVYLDSITLSLDAGSDGAEIGAGLTAGAELGPFAVSVQDLGATLALVPGEDASAIARFGDLGLAVAFRPPSGLGLSIDAAGVASGGGFLSIDVEKGEYSGVVDVELFGVGLTAIGMLSTQLPDGSDGWSMFLSLSATFTGLQLGFGFTLNGVGGLIGVHRGLDAEALGDGIRDGALDSVLFPDDPIADAPRILSDIAAIFPIRTGQYVFGPVAKIGWGTPTLIEADVGVVVQLPDPVTVSLLGSLSAVLPEKDAPLLVLNIDVAGTLDLTAGTLAVDASLRDSSVVGLMLSGDMAIRAAFLDSPSFLLAFGGFNPHFVAPADFPSLDRLSVSLDTGDTLRIGLWGYFAVTSNTVQFGAGADLWASAAGLTVEGHFNFDALLQFEPFLFIIDLGFSVDVRAGSVDLFGVHLALMLEGPNPFHVVGTATMKILGIKTSFEVDETIGRKEVEPPAETVYAQTLLVDALQDPAAWREAPPDADALAVVFADASASDGEVLLHPAGSLEVVQRVVPLLRSLEKYGNAELGDLLRFELLEPTIGGAAASTTSTIDDWFAPAQFFAMDDEERLSAPSFEEMPAGLRFGDDGVDAGASKAFELGYEQIVRDPDVDALERELETLSQPTARSLALAVKRSATARSRRGAGLPTSATRTSPFAIAPASWVVADAATGVVDAAATPLAGGRGVSWSEARAALAGAGPGSARGLVPTHELGLEEAS